jgi:hypothetical protein
MRIKLTILLLAIMLPVMGQWPYGEIPVMIGRYNPDRVAASPKKYVRVYSDSTNRYRFYDMWELLGTECTHDTIPIYDTTTVTVYDTTIVIVYDSNCVEPDPEPDPQPTGQWEGPAQPDLDNLTTIYVTNNNDSGEGSLRWAMEQSGRRRIIPTFSGTIRLHSDIRVDDPHIWYDGASGPSPGLLVVDGSIWITTTDVAITYLHVRLGDQYAKGTNCISILHGSRDVVIDHCSLLWGVDQIIGTNPYFTGPGTVADLERITITNNILSQGLSYSSHRDGEHSKGPLVYFDSKDVLVAYNLMVQNKDRNPLFEGGATGQIIGNMCYWGYQPMSLCFRTNSMTGEPVHHVVDVISNKSSGYREKFQIRFYDFDYNNSRVYMEGNNGPNDDWDTDSIWGNPYESNIRVHSPNFDYGVTIRSANEAQRYVLENAGAFPDNRSVTDQRVVDIFINKPFGDEFFQRGEGNENLIDSPDQIGWDLF